MSLQTRCTRRSAEQWGSGYPATVISAQAIGKLGVDDLLKMNCKGDIGQSLKVPCDHLSVQVGIVREKGHQEQRRLCSLLYKKLKNKNKLQLMITPYISIHGSRMWNRYTATDGRVFYDKDAFGKWGNWGVLCCRIGVPKCRPDIHVHTTAED